MKNRYSVKRSLEILNEISNRLKRISDMQADGCYPTALGKCQGLAILTIPDVEIVKEIIESELEEEELEEDL